MNLETYFMPYQVRWIHDESRRKIWEKSRRIGATYVEAFVKVRKCITKSGHAVWASSADESAAKEFIMYCQQWAKVYQKAGEILSIEEEVIDIKNAIKALVIQFKNGSRVHALSSNPTAFRSKGGDVDLDEFDWHKNPRELYAAAKPVAMWGFDLAILSTYKKKGGLYHQFIEESRKAVADGRQPVFSLHSTTIFDAVEQGLVDKILGHPTSRQEREQWLQEEKEGCGDEDIWLQEYCCQPVDESESFLPWELIKPCEHEDAGKPDKKGTGDFYVGMDIARRRDLTVIWVIEKVGDVFWTREVIPMRRASFAAQDEELDRVHDEYQPRRICMDQTGIGEKPVEDAKKRYGEYTVEGVQFTTAVKQELAFTLRRKFEDREVRIPKDKDIRRSHHAVKKMTTSSGNIRFDAERTDKGHADEFWAHALAVHAGENGVPGKVEYQSIGKRTMQTTGAY